MSASVIERTCDEICVGEESRANNNTIVDDIKKDDDRKGEPPNAERTIDITEETHIIREFVKDLRNDVSYRRRFLLTVSAYWTYLAYGWSRVQLGIALPDLQLLVNIDLNAASWMFTSRGIGYILGSPLFGVLYDRFNRLVIMCSCVLCVVACVACLPYSSEYPVMLVLVAITGVLFGGIETGVNTIVPSIWGNKAGPYMQALFLSYTFGGIIVPFATKPFMTPQHSGTNLKLGNASSSTADNYSESFSNSENFTESTTISLNVSGNEDKPIYNMANQIQYAFILASAMLLLSSIPFIIMALIGGFDLQEYDNPNKTEDTVNIPSGRCSGKRKWVVLTCMVGANSLLCASQSGFNNFAVTFSIDYLEWDNASSVTLLSLYWVASCIGSLAGIVILRVVPTSKLLFIAETAWMFTFMMSLLAGFYKIHLLMWIFIPLSGLVMVIIMPAIISWTEEHVCDITGSVSAMIMVMSGIGYSVNPRFIGYMMDNYSYMAFLYILFAESCVSFICYGVGLIGKYAFLTNKEITKWN